MICREYKIERINKNYIKVSIFTECGNGYSTTIKDEGYDLRNNSSKYLAALQGLESLSEKGHLLINYLNR